mmetsp:Transcript_28435/g.66549  ORF Transcript_28435/g.66549 Transcript_28435/m.66549 type:complete len:244 (-) Transcript_28435:950-1681(-)
MILTLKLVWPFHLDAALTHQRRQLMRSCRNACMHIGHVARWRLVLKRAVGDVHCRGAAAGHSRRRLAIAFARAASEGECGRLLAQHPQNLRTERHRGRAEQQRVERANLSTERLKREHCGVARAKERPHGWWRGQSEQFVLDKRHNVSAEGCSQSCGVCVGSITAPDARVVRRREVAAAQLTKGLRIPAPTAHAVVRAVVSDPDHDHAVEERFCTARLLGPLVVTGGLIGKERRESEENRLRV